MANTRDPSPYPGYLTIVEVAERLGIHATSVRRLLMQGHLRAVKPWQSPVAPWLFEQAAIEQFAQSYHPRPGRKDYDSYKLL